MLTNQLTQQTKEQEVSEFDKLLTKTSPNFPKIGDSVKGTVISVGRNEVRIDIGGIAVGLVRGPELDPNINLSAGDKVEAAVIDLDNEFGEIELSLKGAGRKQSWDNLKDVFGEGTVVPVKILDANKGGLIVRLEGVNGFLPVSQLSPENYPRVVGGEKNKILEKLKELVGQTIDVKIIDSNPEEEKLIVSEKAVWETKQEGVISKYKVGDTVEGEITAVTDFGAFVRFDENLEGLVHISEIAWQRIDHPQDLLKPGDRVKAEIINVEGSKIFLSMKKLIPDPWKGVIEKYKVGQTVKGCVLKINPFGLFVELDPEIHGLAHISELADKPVKDVNEIARMGDELDFRIVSIDPKSHRLGLSLKKAKEEEPVQEPETAVVAEE
ncbi:MAG: S1 RNA-binding domain-containing protein [Patescibacteria group bacterium]|nr:S1 RNA-binding domain-containing protein [Patescibacteria group bacterium]MBU2508954.1 S1 RNA-binding domain-containing protein [Patescibacteria group bacterium]